MSVSTFLGMRQAGPETGTREQDLTLISLMDADDAEVLHWEARVARGCERER